MIECLNIEYVKCIYDNILSYWILKRLINTWSVISASEGKSSLKIGHACKINQNSQHEFSVLTVCLSLPLKYDSPTPILVKDYCVMFSQNLPR